MPHLVTSRSSTCGPESRGWRSLSRIPQAATSLTILLKRKFPASDRVDHSPPDRRSPHTVSTMRRRWAWPMRGRSADVAASSAKHDRTYQRVRPGRPSIRQIPSLLTGPKLTSFATQHLERLNALPRVVNQGHEFLHSQRKRVVRFPRVSAGVAQSFRSFE